MGDDDKMTTIQLSKLTVRKLSIVKASIGVEDMENVVLSLLNTFSKENKIDFDKIMLD